MRKIHTEHVLILYALIAKATSGGARGLRDMEVLKTVIESQDKKDSDSDKISHLYARAAEMMKLIIEKRPFITGNKRAAMLVALTFLKVNGFKLRVRPGDIEDYAVVLSNERPSRRACIGWLKQRCKA